MPKDWCPFCPGSGRVPEHYDVYLYPNDFAAFRLDNEPFEDDPGDAIYRCTGARGATDVVLYHPNHNLAPSQLSAEHWRKVVELWTRRHLELAANPDLRYVYIFENTGTAIGVTMPHPHGQIYAFPFLPPLVERELRAASEYREHRGACVYCDILRQELADRRRIVAENESFVAFAPYFARWPTEMQIYARRHFGGLPDLTPGEATGLAEMIKCIRMKYDRLYGFPMPLMMILRQPPVKGHHPYFHFHLEFYPVQRSATKLKYLAGVESGAGTFLNDTVPEQEARRMREIDAGPIKS